APGRVHFRSPWPAEETVLALRAADLLAIPTLAAQSEVSVPSKLMSCLLAGRAVVAVALPGSALAAAVERSGAGWVVAPGNARLLSDRLTQIAALDRSELLGRGAAGLAFGRREFAPETGPARVVSALERSASGGGEGP